MAHALIAEAPRVPAPAWADVIRVSTHLWRVAERRGRIVGHVRALADEEGWRFRAERFSGAEHRFRPVGEFWRSEEALECLRYLR